MYYFVKDTETGGIMGAYNSLEKANNLCLKLNTASDYHRYIIEGF